MFRKRQTHVLLALLALAVPLSASNAAAQEATLRLISPVPGQEVMVRIVSTPAHGSADAAVTVLGHASHHAAGGAYELRTPLDIRLDPVQAFRVTFATVSPQQLLRVVLTPGAETEAFIDGTELVLLRRSAGAVVEMEASAPQAAPGQRADAGAPGNEAGTVP